MKYLAALLLSFTFATSAMAETGKAALNGYCPVCYLAANKAVPGTEKFQATHEGKRYLFASQDALDAFNKSPEKFIPAYDGQCAFCIANGKFTPGDPEIFMVHDGRIFLNKTKELEDKFKSALKENIAKADGIWKDSQKG